MFSSDRIKVSEKMHWPLIYSVMTSKQQTWKIIYWCTIKKMPQMRLSGSLNSVHLRICIIAVLIYKLICNFYNILTSAHRMDFSRYDLAKVIITNSLSLLICCGKQKVSLFINSLEFKSSLSPSSQKPIVILFFFLNWAVNKAQTPSKILKSCSYSVSSVCFSWQSLSERGRVGVMKTVINIYQENELRYLLCFSSWHWKQNIMELNVIGFFLFFNSS